MKSFAYSAVDDSGRAVTGAIEADNWPAAESELARRGLTEIRPAPHADSSARTRELSKDEAIELAGYMAQLAGSGLPLESGLRAFAHDARSSSLGQVLDTLAARLEAGHSLESALGTISDRLPPYVREVIVTAGQSGQLSQALDDLVTHERSMTNLTRRLRQAVAYPAVLFAFLAGWVLFVAIFVYPTVPNDIVDEFDVRSNASVMMLNSQQIVVGFFRWFPIALAILGGAIALAITTALWVGGKGALSWLFVQVPLLGPAWRQRGVVDLSGLLALLLRRGLAMPDALRLASAAARDPYVSSLCQGAAERVSRGASLATALDGFWTPATLTRLIEWGERTSKLPKALEMGRAMFGARFTQQTELTRLVLPPIVFVLVAATVLFTMSTMFTILRLITDLAS